MCICPAVCRADLSAAAFTRSTPTPVGSPAHSSTKKPFQVADVGDGLPPGHVRRRLTSQRQRLGAGDGGGHVVGDQGDFKLGWSACGARGDLPMACSSACGAKRQRGGAGVQLGKVAAVVQKAGVQAKGGLIESQAGRPRRTLQDGVANCMDAPSTGGDDASVTGLGPRGGGRWFRASGLDARDAASLTTPSLAPSAVRQQVRQVERRRFVGGAYCLFGWGAGQRRALARLQQLVDAFQHLAVQLADGGGQLQAGHQVLVARFAPGRGRIRTPCARR